MKVVWSVCRTDKFRANFKQKTFPKMNKIPQTINDICFLCQNIGQISIWMIFYLFIYIASLFRFHTYTYLIFYHFLSVTLFNFENNFLGLFFTFSFLQCWYILARNDLDFFFTFLTEWTVTLWNRGCWIASHFEGFVVQHPIIII